MEKGLVLIITGNGKGKTTAAMGTAIRSLGWGRKVLIIQFLKSEEMESGEREFFKNQKLEFYTTGIGFSWTKSHEEQLESIKKAWVFTKEKMMDESYDLIILDEIINIFNIKDFDVSNVITEDELIEVINERPDKNNDIILTGRGASQKLIEFADTVSEVREIKHAYRKGIKAKKGIEY